MVRLATEKDMPAVDALYEASRRFMAENGNPSQWGNKYPLRETLLEDISLGRLFVCCDDREVYGVFALVEGDDPTYAIIEDGAWGDDSPYAAIHRVAGGRGRGVAAECFGYAKKRFPHLRVDTHADNIPMQRCILKNGFVRRGVIYVRDHSPRVAFEYSR